MLLALFVVVAVAANKKLEALGDPIAYLEIGVAAAVDEGFRRYGLCGVGFYS